MLITEKSNNDLSSVTVVYENPVSYETIENSGVSHIIEHMMCNSYSDLENEFFSRCLKNNAETSRGQVTFYLRGLNKELYTYANVFVERILSYVPTKKDFEKEMAIIKNEFRDSMFYTHNANIKSVAYTRYNMLSPIGLLEVLESITFNEVKDFFDKYFKAPSKIIVIGDLFIDKPDNFQYLKPNEESIKSVSQKHFNPVILSQENKGLDYTFSSPLLQGNDYYLFLTRLLLIGTLKAPLYKELREKQGLCYSIHGHEYSLGSKEVLIYFINSSKTSKCLIKSFYKIFKNIEKHISEQDYLNAIKFTEIQYEIENQNNYELDWIFYDERKEYREEILNPNKLNYKQYIDFFKKIIYNKGKGWEVFTNEDINKLSIFYEKVN
jgi:predicted Zn-dependent peptidase